MASVLPPLVKLMPLLVRLWLWLLAVTWLPSTLPCSSHKHSTQLKAGFTTEWLMAALTGPYGFSLSSDGLQQGRVLDDVQHGT